MISAAPGGGADTVFNAPPGWLTPAGFDPRRGHLPDPTWPAAPAGWQFWVARPQPRGLVPALKRGWWGPAVGGAVVVLLVLVALLHGPSSPTDGVGSCWTEGSGGRLTSVDCSSSRAMYRVSSVVARPELCSKPSPGYLEGATGFECLTAMS